MSSRWYVCPVILSLVGILGKVFSKWQTGCGAMRAEDGVAWLKLQVTGQCPSDGGVSVSVIVGEVFSRKGFMQETINCR